MIHIWRDCEKLFMWRWFIKYKKEYEKQISNVIFAYIIRVFLTNDNPFNFFKMGKLLIFFLIRLKLSSIFLLFAFFSVNGQYHQWKWSCIVPQLVGVRVAKEWRRKKDICSKQFSVFVYFFATFIYAPEHCATLFNYRQE